VSHALKLQVDGVVEDNYDNAAIEETNTPQSGVPQSWGRPRATTNKGKALEAVELPQRPTTPSTNRARSGSSLESTPKRTQERQGIQRKKLPVSITLLFLIPC
jgi:hypothetical protein